MVLKLINKVFKLIKNDHLQRWVWLVLWQMVNVIVWHKIIITSLFYTIF